VGSGYFVNCQKSLGVFLHYKEVKSMKQTGQKNSNAATILTFIGLGGGIFVLLALWLCLVYPLILCTFATTTFAPQPGIRVKLLPPGVWDEPDLWEKAGSIMRIVNPEGAEKYGTMILNDEIVDVPGLLWKFQNAPNESKRMLIIQSERNVLHEQIVMVMDMAKRAGVDEMAYLRLTYTSRERARIKPRIKVESVEPHNRTIIKPRSLIRPHE